MFKRVFFVIYKFGRVCAIHVEAQSLVLRRYERA